MPGATGPAGRVGLGKPTQAACRQGV